jgi:hypothetical protein
VQLVDDDVAQVGQQLRPAVVVRQDPAVQHVRVGGDRVGLGARGPALVRRGVAVVGAAAEQAVTAAGDRQLAQAADLVARQRLGREQHQRARRGIREHRLHDRDLKAKRFTGRRRRRQHDVPTRERGREGGRLVGVGSLDPPRRERREQASIDRHRPVDELAVTRRNAVYGDDLRGAAQTREQLGLDRGEASVGADQLRRVRRDGTEGRTKHQAPPRRMSETADPKPGNLHVVPGSASG